MAQASSAQREPSMEEILASIRRIIEDSDTGRGPIGSDAGSARQAADAGRAANSVIDVDAFRAELRSRPIEAEARPVEPIAKPSTLADIQARISADDAAPVEATPVAVAPDPRETVAASIPASDPPEIIDETAETDMELEIDAVPVEAAPEPHFMAPPFSAPAGRPAILSEQAGRQVAASFGELSEAFAASRKKSFDEMAEEMMRPMLQDWLDNNLPVLVERLVREEIERVARGVPD